MTLRILKTAAVAAFVLIGTLGVALAEVPALPTPAQLSALARLHSPAMATAAGSIAEGTGMGHMANGTAVAAPQLASGWNAEICSTALWYFDGTYHFLFAFNSDTSYLYAYSTSSTQTSLQGTMLSACSTGGTYHVYLAGSPGSFTIQYLQNR